MLNIIYYIILCSFGALSLTTTAGSRKRYRKTKTDNMVVAVNDIPVPTTIGGSAVPLPTLAEPNRPLNQINSLTTPASSSITSFSPVIQEAIKPTFPQITPVPAPQPIVSDEPFTPTAVAEPQPLISRPNTQESVPINNFDTPLNNNKPIRQNNIPLASSLQANGPERIQQIDDEKEEIIEFHFENAELLNFVKQIEDIFEVTFLTDDALDPLPKTGRSLKGNKITFKTENPLTRLQAWNLFMTFLQISGFAVIQLPEDRTYRIAPLESSIKAAIPAYIGVDPDDLPSNDEIIRYIYFVQNSPLESIKAVIDPLRSVPSSFILLQEHKAFILTDKAYNIKILMEIVKALDKSANKQVLSVVKLHKTDAQEIKRLYDSLAQTDERNAPNKLLSRKQPTSLFFPETLRMIAEPRTNALILLGPIEAIQQVEKFIKDVDTDLNQPYSPLYVHQLKYADANTIADIMNNVTQFSQKTPADKLAGTRGLERYMQPISFVAEKETNRLVIKGFYDDYLKAVDIIEKLDKPQPQVAIEVLILGISLQESKGMGTQLRSKDINTGVLGDNVKFQTSGLFTTSTIVPNNSPTATGTQRLLGNILELVRNGASTGTTLITLGQDLFGVWGVFEMLQTVANTQVLSNPFLIATNKTPATVSLGEERRVRTAEVISLTTTDSFGKDEAKLEVSITPQINSDGMIVLNLVITFNDYIDTVNRTDATKNIREIRTNTIVADKEILALGGLIRDRIVDTQSKVPLLGEVPVIGWLFKNKLQTTRRENLLILISTHILEPENAEDIQRFTQKRMRNYYGTLDDMEVAADHRDPIHKIFFQDDKQEDSIVENLLFDRKKHNTDVVSKRRRQRRRSRTKKDVIKSEERYAPAPTIIPAQALQPAPTVVALNKPAMPPKINPSVPSFSPSSSHNKLSTKLQQKGRTSLSVSEFLANEAHNKVRT